VRLALAQVDCVLGEEEANLASARCTVDRAAGEGADLVVFPELALHGYTLSQLRDDRAMHRDDPRLAALTQSGADVLIGFHEEGGMRRYNAAGYWSPGTMPRIHRKLYLPTYLSWEERKVSSPGQALTAFDTRHGRMATLICSDAWQLALPWLAVQDGAEVLLIPANSAVGPSSEALDVIDYWYHLLPVLARMLQCWVVFVNRVGEEHERRFWGGSTVIDPTGTVTAQAAAWEPDLVLVDVDVPAVRRLRRQLPLVGEARLGLVGREVARLIADGGDA